MSENTQEYNGIPCKLWTKSRDSKGYGVKRINGKLWRVHRLTWAGANGAIPDKSLVLHHCDNRDCYELQHLFLGTYKDNTQDMVTKDRGRGQFQPKTHCKNGHELTPDNSGINSNGQGGYGRYCRICRRAWQNRRRSPKT